MTSTKKMYTVNVPENFARTIVELYGEAGRAWLARLPSLVTEYAQQWSLTVNYVAPAVRADGTDDRARIVGWGLAQAVLSAWWSLEDHGYGWE